MSFQCPRFKEKIKILKESINDKIKNSGLEDLIQEYEETGDDEKLKEFEKKYEELNEELNKQLKELIQEIKEKGEKLLETWIHNVIKKDDVINRFFQILNLTKKK